MWCRYICIGLAIAVTVVGCQRNNAPGQDVSSQTLRRGIGGEPATLDPGKAVDTFSFEVIRDIYEGLVAESPDGTVRPGVASSWEISPSGIQYIFEIRPNAKWSNGQRIRAQDFVSEWRRIVNPREASPVADLLRPIANAAKIIAGNLPPEDLGAQALSEDRLVVNLEQPAPYFLQLLTHSATFPIFSRETSENPKVRISNGPYVLSNWTPGGSLTLVKNPEYWDRNNVKIERVEYIPISDENSEFNRYQAGQIDITQSVPPNALPIIRREFPNDLLLAHYLGTVYYALNLHSGSLSGNLSARQALAMSIDRNVLSKTVLIFGQTPAFGFVPPGTWNYDQQTWPWQSMSDKERTDEARRLYGIAGYSSSKPLHLRMLFSTNPEIKKLSVAVASMWKQELGVTSEIMEEEYRVFLDSRRDPSRWDVARLSWVADYNDAGNFLDTFRTGSPNNDTGYSNPQFDSLLDRAATTADSSSRKSLLERAENLMLSDYPILPIYFYSTKRLVKPYIKGVSTNPLNRLYSKQLSMDQNSSRK
jgi:oligopeptide transport system substrate-binding protein